MKILVAGSGGREHAIIKKLSENKNITKIYALPGNGGIASIAECVPIKATEIEKIRDFAIENKIDFAAVIPDDPLVMGAIDLLEEAGIKCFGPNKKAAIIEGSKVFSKQLMKKYGIPTANYESFDNYEKAIEYLDKINKYPAVIKADGLALGKGVIIAQNRDEAVTAIDEILCGNKFGTSGNKIVIEEYLTGPEVSVLAFTDGKTIIPMISAMDHKRALDGDRGLNTGGMGTIAPNPFYKKEIADECMKRIFIPTINAMNSENRKFKGCLFFGLMLTPEGPSVIEYNCRFGDPETQVVIPLLKTDLFDIMNAIADEKLSKITVEFEDKAACCVIIASGGYPDNYKKGYDIIINENPDVTVYHAGTAEKDGKLITSGGRVVGLTAIDKTLDKAILKVYNNIHNIQFFNSYYRNDIGKSVL